MYQPKQIIIGADDKGNPTGEYFSRRIGHKGAGKRHFAVSFFLINSKGELLLQRRKHKIFDNFWDTTGSTHQLHKKDGTNETDEEASDRGIRIEYEIVEGNIKWRNFGGFNYFAQYGQYCENEYDKMLVGKYDGEVSLNPKEGYEIKWLGRKKYLSDITKNPQKYTPWAIEGTKLLKTKGFFN